MDHFEKSCLLRPLNSVKSFSELELIAADGVRDKGFPVFVVDLLNIELLFNFLRAVRDVELVAVYLGKDDVNIGHGGFDEGLVFAAFGKIVEMGSEFHEVCFGFDILMEGLHLMIGLFAEDEERYLVVGFDGHEIVDVGRNKFEDEHDIVSFVKI